MWFILVIPTTFAQPIALAIKGSGPKAYLGVQILTALAFIAAFLPSTLSSQQQFISLSLAFTNNTNNEQCGFFGRGKSTSLIMRARRPPSHNPKQIEPWTRVIRHPSSNLKNWTGPPD